MPEKDLRKMIREAHDRARGVSEMMRGLHVPYYRRGEMSIPAFKLKAGGNPETEGREASLKIMRKAAELPVDFFFYDLEDAAPDNAELKPWARKFVMEALTKFDFGQRVVAFRPNNLRTNYFEDDVLTVVGQAGQRLQAIVYPKSETADEVKDVAALLKAVQKAYKQDNRICIEVLIESPRAFAQAERIAAIPEVSALIFGAWDFARTIGGKVEPESWLRDQVVARQTLPIIAAAYGKDAVDAVTGTLPIRPKAPAGVSEAEAEVAIKLPFTHIDPKKFGDDFIKGVQKREGAIALARRDAEDARRCGYAAKWILHPDQIEAIQGAWTPTRERALQALKLTADYARAAQKGSGAEVDGDRLADKAVVGTDWWIVVAAMKGGVLTDKDVSDTGFTLPQLQRTVRIRD